VGERSEYVPGTFCWTDLSTPNQGDAKEFYCELFGWRAQDVPIGEGAEVYSLMRLDGSDVAAISAQPAQQRDAGVPPMWNSYVAVASADAAAAQAAELGANVHAGPFDVMAAGRMAVIQDPQGAFFEIWESRERLGATLVNAPGALVWNELATPDPNASAAFYGELFGWSSEPFEGAQGSYLAIRNGPASAGGIRGLKAPGMAPQWLVYFGVADIDAGVERVSALGGAVLGRPVDMGVGRIASVTDRQGAQFALYAGDLDP
jgi:predicted enzyme related to lactoylglutathione lyase